MRYLFFFCFAILVCSCKDYDYAGPPDFTHPKYQMPEQIYGDFYREIQMFKAIPEKDFADAIPKRDPMKIYNDFRRAKNDLDFDLKIFLTENFELPEREITYVIDSSRAILESINLLWDSWKRPADQLPTSQYATLIPMPNPYTVMWDGADDITYWDMYFAMLGLREDGDTEMIENMVKNFSHLIEELGFIPQSNRSYNVSRSHFPVFMDMVTLLAETKNDVNVYIAYLPYLQKEYDYWMSEDNNKVVNFEGFTFNRFYDHYYAPRPEHYHRDGQRDHDNDWRAGWQTMQEIRSATESGQNFSARFLSRSRSSSTSIATKIIPVDLNSALFQMEMTLAKANTLANQRQEANKYQELASDRKEAILQNLWHRDKKIFSDLDMRDTSLTDRFSYATLYPMYYEMIDQGKADSIALFVQEELLANRGLKGTAKEYWQRWDAPYGWAHQQWVAYRALNNYGHHDLANEIASRWTGLVEKVYNLTGVFDDYYDVTDVNIDISNERINYAWTVGVYQALKADRPQ